MRYLFFLLVTLGCQNKITINAKIPTTNVSEPLVTKVQIVDGKVELLGSRLSQVTRLRVLDGKNTHSFTIDSKTDSKIIASSLSNITFALNHAMNFLISNAAATSSFIVDFTLCNSSLNGGRFDCSLTAQDKEVLAFDAVSGTWKPRAISGLVYKGVLDANDPFPSASDPGDYFIVGVAGNGYNVGDWITFNGSMFQKISNSQAVLSVFGRTGAIIAQKGDYSLSQMRDVSFTTAPISQQALVYNGTSWGARDISSIVSDSVQTISGDKNFQGTLVAENGLKIGSVSTACNSISEGTLRFNSATKKMEFCNSSNWTPVSTPSAVSATGVTITIGTPTASIVQNGPVTFPVTYSSGTDASSINLTPDKIFFTGAGATGCRVSSITGSALDRSVTVEDCAGTGSVAILIAPGTATSTTGSTAGSSSPSGPFTADNSGPPAVSITLGAVPADTTKTPQFNFTPTSDVGGSGVDYFEVRIVKTDSGEVVKDWSAITSGQELGALSLLQGTQYSAQIRGVDILGNIGASSSTVSWTTPVLDPCLAGSVAAGTTCSGGSFYAGSIGESKYMAAPAGCGAIPVGQRVSGSFGGTDYPNADFTPVCNGNDSSYIVIWNNGYGNFYDIPELINYTTTAGIGNGAINIDANSGSVNTAVIAAITDPAKGGNHAAAKYCDKLSIGGHTDWFLPNRQELNLLYENRASIPGIYGSVYWSSTEASAVNVWVQDLNSGFQTPENRSSAGRIRCMRKI